jgi:hypothetical protein
MPKKRFRESIAAAADRHRRKAGLLVPISAKKLATRCDFVQQREKKDLRKLHAVARLRKVRKNSGGFDSLHPLQVLQGVSHILHQFCIRPALPAA